MKDRVAQLTASRKQLLQQMTDLSAVLPGSLLSRMVRCNKPGCRFCEKGKGKGHGPIWILSVSLGNRQVRQIPVPNELKQEVEESLRAFAQMQHVLKQIAQVKDFVWRWMVATSGNRSRTELSSMAVVAAMICFSS